MPLYSWRCEHCQKELDVLRPFAEYDSPPSTDEGGACDFSERRGAAAHSWEKRIRAPRVERGPGWGGSKGNWVLAALAIGVSALLGGCPRSCPVTKEIAEVGGCTADTGNCGVRFTDGTFGDEYHPVRGQRVRVYVTCKAESGE